MNGLGTITRLIPGTTAHRRQRYVSASTAACLFGCHPFLTVGQLAAIKRGEVEDTAGEAAETGNVLEDVVAQWWADRNGVTVEVPTATYVNGPLSASPDRLIVGCWDTLLEVKTTSEKEGSVKPYWWWQVQAQMACTGAVQTAIAVLWGGSLRLREYTVGYDEGAVGRLVEAADAFLAALDLGMDPEPAHLEPEATTVKVGLAEAQLVSQWRHAKGLRDEADREATEARAKIVALLGAPGLAPGSRLNVVDGDGKALCRVRVQNGRVPLVPVEGATRGDPVVVVEEA